jgi:TM2 domain-containing membrane protein YozV
VRVEETRMSPYVQLLLSYVRPESQGAFLYEYRRYAKDASVALLLAIVFGIVGGESYYLGEWRRGLLMTLALFSGIGLFVSIPMWVARCFTISTECEFCNDILAYELAFHYLPLGTGAPQPPPQTPRASRGPIGGLPMRTRA